MYGTAIFGMPMPMPLLERSPFQLNGGRLPRRTSEESVARYRALEGTNHGLTSFNVHVTDIWPVSRPLDVNPM